LPTPGFRPVKGDIDMRTSSAIGAIAAAALGGSLLMAAPSAAATGPTQTWCQYEVVSSGGHTVLNVRAEPNANSALRYQITADQGHRVMARADTTTNGYRNMNYSLGTSQWGHQDLLRNRGNCESRPDPI
jgi:outer membrane lipoprotein SlyB